MIKINRDHLEEGLLVNGLNNKSEEAELIRIGVHSVFNHNAMTVKPNGKWGFAEAVPPYSKVTSIDDYESLINTETTTRDGKKIPGYIIRFYRLKSLTCDERRGAAKYFVMNLLNLPYPRKIKMVLLALPIYNAFVDKTGLLPHIRMNWCSQLDKRAFLSQDPNCLDGLNGKKKELFTPKTFENRIIQGLFDDVTDNIIDSDNQIWHETIG